MVFSDDSAFEKILVIADFRYCRYKIMYNTVDINLFPLLFSVDAAIMGNK